MAGMVTCRPTFTVIGAPRCARHSAVDPRIHETA